MFVLGFPLATLWRSKVMNSIAGAPERHSVCACVCVCILVCACTRESEDGCGVIGGRDLATCLLPGCDSQTDKI